jgi:hypothetical protein
VAACKLADVLYVVGDCSADHAVIVIQAIERPLVMMTL